MRRVDELEEKLAASEETAHGLELELCQAKAEAARSTATAEEMRAAMRQLRSHTATSEARHAAEVGDMAQSHARALSQIRHVRHSPSTRGAAASRLLNSSEAFEAASEGERAESTSDADAASTAGEEHTAADEGLASWSKGSAVQRLAALSR